MPEQWKVREISEERFIILPIQSAANTFELQVDQWPPQMPLEM